MRVAVIVHVFYPQLAGELAACVGNIREPKDVFVTFADGAAESAARAAFPDAALVRCENRGYDIWPFLKVLNGLDHDRYTHVVKLHTKRDVPQRLKINGTCVQGSRWREALLSFVRTPAAWQEALRRLDGDPTLGMVAASLCVLNRRGTTGPEEIRVYDEAVAESVRRFGCPADRFREARFVGGTMFLARASALAALKGRFVADDFAATENSHASTTFAHVAERMLGFAVSAAGLRVGAAAQPLVSVLMPAFNHERYVEEAVRSVLAQDGVRIELVVIDDGSADATWEILQRIRPACEARLERVTMERQPNRGTRATVSRLLSLATGDAVAVMASDDAFLPGALAAMLAELEREGDVGVVVGVNEWMDAESRRCFWDGKQNAVYDPGVAVDLTFNAHLARVSGVGGDDPRFGTYRALVRCNHVANGMLIRKRFLDAVGPTPEEVPLEDHWLMLQLSKVCRMKAVDVPTFRYRWHGGNSIRQRERMVDFANRTLRYEERNVFARREERWMRDCMEYRAGFGLFRLLRVERYRTPFAKVLALTQFGRTAYFRREFPA